MVIIVLWQPSLHSNIAFWKLALLATCEAIQFITHRVAQYFSQWVCVRSVCVCGKSMCLCMMCACGAWCVYVVHGVCMWCMVCVCGACCVYVVHGVCMWCVLCMCLLWWVWCVVTHILCSLVILKISVFWCDGKVCMASCWTINLCHLEHDYTTCVCASHTFKQCNDWIAHHIWLNFFVIKKFYCHGSTPKSQRSAHVWYEIRGRDERSWDSRVTSHTHTHTHTHTPTTCTLISTQLYPLYEIQQLSF